MKMLKHIPTGRVYVFSEPLSRADDMEEFDDPDFGKQNEPVTEPEAPSAVQEPEQDEVQPEPVDSKSLDEMTRDELIAVAEAEERARGDKVNLSRMKKADLIVYIKGEGA